MIPISSSPLLASEQANIAWLLDALGETGNHFKDFLSGMTVEKTGGHWSSCARLLLHYKGEREEAFPSSLFLKVAGGPTSEFGDSEVRYYTDIGAVIPNAPLPRCYHAAYSGESHHYHLLLEDLSLSHETTWERSWTLDEAKRLAEAFASLHSAWWDRDTLASLVAPLPDDDILARYLQSARPGLAPLLESVTTRLSPEQQDIIRRVYDVHPHLMQQRANQGTHFTCIHGDPNPGNILCPRSSPGRCVLIDRQPFEWSLKTWTGASDLAYAMVHWWPTPLRTRLEVPLLQHYYTTLVSLGVRDYSWDELWHDYRLAALQSFYVVGDWCSEPKQMADFEWVWWPQLQKTLQAFDDLKGDELLKEQRSDT